MHMLAGDLLNEFVLVIYMLLVLGQAAKQFCADATQDWPLLHPLLVMPMLKQSSHATHLLVLAVQSLSVQQCARCLLTNLVEVRWLKYAMWSAAND